MEGQQMPDPKIVAQYMLRYMKEDENLIKFQLDQKKELNDFKDTLLGVSYDKEGRPKIINEDMAFVNEAGANTIVGIIKPDSSKIVSLSNFRFDIIDNMALEDLNEFTYFLVRHKQELGFRSLQTISMVLGRMNKMNYATMMKAKEGFEARGIRDQFTHVESDEKVTQLEKPNRFFGGLLNKGAN